MKRIVSIIILFVASTSAHAKGMWYEFQGTIHKVNDYTYQKFVNETYQDTPVRHVFYVDDEKPGFYLTNIFNKDNIIKPNNRKYSESSYSNYYYADYSCGTALNIGYYAYEYFIVKSQKSYSTERSFLNVGRRIDLSINELYGNWYIGSEAVVKNYMQIDGTGGTAYTIANVNLTNIYTENPCQ
jgi:hypothetical protein